jgi:hypothetical protein
VRAQAIGGEFFGQRLAGDLKRSPMRRRCTREMQMRSKQVRQQLIANKRVGPIARQHKMRFEPQSGACSGGHPAMVRLPSTHCDEAIGALGHGLAAQILEFSSLITAGSKSGEVVAFDPQSRAILELWALLKVCWQGGKVRSGQSGESTQRHYFDCTLAVNQTERARAACPQQ